MEDNNDNLSLIEHILGGLAGMLREDEPESDEDFLKKFVSAVDKMEEDTKKQEQPKEEVKEQPKNPKVTVKSYDSAEDFFNDFFKANKARKQEEVKEQPKEQFSSDEEELKYLRTQVELLKSENEALAKKFEASQKAYVDALSKVRNVESLTKFVSTVYHAVETLEKESK